MMMMMTVLVWVGVVVVVVAAAAAMVGVDHWKYGGSSLSYPDTGSSHRMVVVVVEALRWWWWRRRTATTTLADEERTLTILARSIDPKRHFHDTYYYTYIDCVVRREYYTN